MIEMVKKKLKSEKGFTLIELLAVIVILGILAAIAVPSILGIIGNSKNDAHAANAQQMISAAKMLVASDANYQTGTHNVTLYGLVYLKYLDPVDSPEDPYKTGEYATKTIVEATAADVTANSVSYVTINNGIITGINLITNGSTAKYIRVTGNPLSAKDIDRGDVN